MKQSEDLKSMTDEQLMKEFIQRQNEQAFAELYQNYFSEVCRYATWLFGDRDAAQDLVQGVFLKIYQKPKSFNLQKDFKVWLFTVTKNAWKNELRANGIRKQKHEEISLVVEDVPIAQHSYKLKKIEEALQKLSSEHREVFILKYANSLSLQEISEVCNCSLGTVKSRLFYALKYLRELVKKDKTIYHE